MDIYYQGDKFKQVLHRYEELQKDNISEFLDPEGLTDVAEYYHYIGEDNNALGAIDHTTRLYPTATTPLAFRARSVLFIDEDPKLANEIAEMIVDKSDLDYLYLKAETMIVDNETDEADDFLRNQYDEVTSQEDHKDYVPGVTVLFSDYEGNEYVEKWLSRSTKTEDNDYKELRARLLKSRGEYKESESILNELLSTNPYSGPYWSQLTQNQLLRNDIKDSITLSEHSIAINPDDEEAILNKANGLFTLGNYKGSLKYYERYKELCHNQDTTVVDVTIGYIHLMQGNASEAQRYYHLALAGTQSKSLTLIHTGISTFDNRYVEYAYNIFSTLLPEADDDWDIGFAYLTRCYYELELEKELNIHLRQVIERNPKESIEVLSDLYLEGTSPQDYPNIRIL